MRSQNSELSRRSFIQKTAGLIAAATIPAIATGKTAAPSGAPIRIGHQCDLTGALASTGYWRKKATDAAVKWLNERGGIAGRPVEVVTTDTETKVDVGVLRIRQMIQDEKVDFVIGSEHGGIGIASTRIAQDLKTPYFSMSRTDGVTETAANPYVFRLMVNTSLVSKAAGSWVVGQTGKRWGVLYADYVWGQSHRDAWSKAVQGTGGVVLQAQAMPVNVADSLPYVSKLPRSVDAIFVAVLGPDMPRALPLFNQVGFAGKHIVTADALFGTFDILGLGAQAEGIWGMDSLPWELEDLDTPHMRTMRTAVGLDAAGREAGTNHFCMVGDILPAWENLGFIKKNVEGSGWKSRNDAQAFIKHAEANPNYQESELFPQGSVFVRPQDHQAFSDYYVFRIEKGRIRVKNRIAKEVGIYPTSVDITSA